MKPSDLQYHQDKYCTRKVIERALSKSVVSEKDVMEMMNRLVITVSAQITSNACQSDIELLMHKERDHILAETERLWVDSELPHTKWLFGCLCNALGEEYVVKSREDNLKYVTGSEENIELSAINDYAASMADLVIHKNQVNANQNVCMIIFERVSIVAEVKEKDDGDYPLSECIRNMSGVAAAQVVQALQQGFVVDTVSIYGIVMIVSDIDKARLLKLEIDFKQNTTKYLKSFGHLGLIGY